VKSKQNGEGRCGFRHFYCSSMSMQRIEASMNLCVIA